MRLAQMSPIMLIDSNIALIFRDNGHAKHSHSVKSVHFQLENNQIFSNNEIRDDEDFRRRWYTDDSYDQLDHECAMKTPSKNVRFDLMATHVIVVDDYSHQSAMHRWYGSNDYKKFKINAQHDAQLVQYDETYDTYREIFQEMFTTCCQYQEQTTVNGDIPTVCPSLQDAFNKVVHDQSEALGLDKYSIKSVVLSRLTRRRELNYFVQRLQEESCMGSCFDTLLRQGCEDISRSNSIFALLMAKAIACSVAKE